MYAFIAFVIAFILFLVATHPAAPSSTIRSLGLASMALGMAMGARP